MVARVLFSVHTQSYRYNFVCCYAFELRQYYAILQIHFFGGLTGELGHEVARVTVLRSRNKHSPTVPDEFSDEADPGIGILHPVR